MAQHFYFKFIPSALELGDPETTAYIENLLANDPMHNWVNRSTEELKKEVRSGKMQQLYKDLFQEEGSHWHVSYHNRVTYQPVDEKRVEILWIEVLQSDGSVRRFENSQILPQDALDYPPVREMDCVDCHN